MLERRAKYRAKTALPGGAVFAKVADETPCVIVNMSAHGACIAFAPGTDIPRVFGLRIGRDGTQQTARIVWRRTNTVGVAFVVPRAVPDVLPG
ncbi:PilZ domain-containing protein [Methylobacterium sp. J-030]|uniref:PilZ domain-containing protein n=1 Tax=Methylobacterium sp. J-030 TaxID=2836627 RepID=UPI00391CA52D